MKLLLLLTTTIFSLRAFAWGPTGHRAVGAVADKYLKNATKKKIAKILDNHSLARVSNWPDKIKSAPEKYAHTFRWHYTDWPSHNLKYDAENNSGSLITSIQEQVETLKNKKKSKDEKVFALKFLVHLIGDLHQPLHVGNGLDRGGNLCQVLFHNNRTNLHRLWDEDMINFTKLSYTEFVNFITVKSKKEVSDAKKGAVIDWAKESKELRETIYPEDPVKDFKPSRKKVSPLSYCQKGESYKDEQLPGLRWPYSYKFMQIVERRIFLAGVRLAKLLDETL